MHASGHIGSFNPWHLRRVDRRARGCEETKQSKGKGHRPSQARIPQVPKRCWGRHAIAGVDTPWLWAGMLPVYLTADELKSTSRSPIPLPSQFGKNALMRDIITVKITVRKGVMLLCRQHGKVNHESGARQHAGWHTQDGTSIQRGWESSCKIYVHVYIL